MQNKGIALSHTLYSIITKIIQKDMPTLYVETTLLCGKHFFQHLKFCCGWMEVQAIHINKILARHLIRWGKTGDQ